MASASYCNVSIATPAADPQKPIGLTPIPSNSSLQNAIRIINNNFVTLSKGNFRENRAARQTTITRVFDPAGTGAFVDVRQITAMEFINPFTGQLITWQQ